MQLALHEVVRCYARTSPRGCITRGMSSPVGIGSAKARCNCIASAMLLSGGMQSALHEVVRVLFQDLALGVHDTRHEQYVSKVACTVEHKHLCA